MNTCKVCNEEILEGQGVFFWGYPFDRDERKVHRACQDEAGRIREALRRKMFECAEAAVMASTGCSANEAAWYVNGVGKGLSGVSEEAEALISLYHQRFGARKPEPLDPFAYRAEREMVGNLLMVRPRD